MAMNAQRPEPAGLSRDEWLTNDHAALAHSWLPVAWSAEVGDEPVRVWLLGDPYVTFRSHGRVAVLPDRCPHRLAPLSRGTVVGGAIQCAYHGWCFDSRGTCTSIPSLGEGATLPPKARLQAPFGVEERYGIVFVALEPPMVDIVDLPHPEPSAVGRLTTKAFEGGFGAALLIDNQLDFSHFAFVHRATFGSDAAAVTPRYDVRRDDDGWGFTVIATVPITAANDPGVAAGIRPLKQHRTMTYRYRVPFQLSLVLDYPDMGVTNSIAFFAQPQRRDTARLFARSVLERVGGFTDDEYATRAAFEDRVGAEDRAIQASFDVLGVPLDQSAECHVRSDRASIEYRRILARLVDVVAEDSAMAEATKPLSFAHPGVREPTEGKSSHADH
jgi:phenylpropionate dioxygenase-like ring-hydroxylating dioxygenase large terminal subunit